jgi:hypothetical protein
MAYIIEFAGEAFDTMSDTVGTLAEFGCIVAVTTNDGQERDVELTNIAGKSDAPDASDELCGYLVDEQSERIGEEIGISWDDITKVHVY